MKTVCIGDAGIYGDLLAVFWSMSSSGVFQVNAIAGKFSRPSRREWVVDAEIIAIDRQGIKVRLKKAMARDNIVRVKVTMRLPESGAPFSLHGILEQLPNGPGNGNRDFDHLKGSIDDMRFECVKLDHSTLLIKTYIS